MNKVSLHLRKLLLSGGSPERLAASITAALLTGTFPVLGSTTILTATTALTLRLNLPLMQTINYCVYPLQLLLYLPLLLLGASLLDPSQSKLTIQGVWGLMRADLTGAVRQLFWANLGAILIWACVAFPAAALIFLALRRLMRNLHNKYSPSA